MTRTENTFAAERLPNAVPRGDDAVTIAVGDRITFRAVTRNGAPLMTRVVNGFWPNGDPTVRAHGWSQFAVRPQEITAISKRALA